MSGTDCGIGSDGTYTGPCTGTLYPADAGKGVFDGLSNVSAVQGIVGAGALIAGLIFALFVARLVGAFFGRKSKKPMQDEPEYTCPACSAFVEDDGAGLFTCDECGFACRDPDEHKPEKFSKILKDHAREDRKRRVAEHRASVEGNDLDSADDEEIDAEDDCELCDEDDHDADSPGAPEKHQ